jgi:spermidine/putrescine-binding protein
MTSSKLPSRLLLALFVACLTLDCARAQDDVLRVFAWNGYVTSADLVAVNAQLLQLKNPVRAVLIRPYAEGPEQMFTVIRQGRADVAFLTLNYLKMQNEKTASLLQAINTASPRLGNFKHVLPALRAVPMGLDSHGSPLYVPFGGGAYGLWANIAKVGKDNLPRRLNDLLDVKWTGRISLSSGQVQPNVALAMMATGHSPFILDDLVTANDRPTATKLAAHDGPAQLFLNRLYAQVGAFWASAPRFEDSLWLVASYGPEMADLRAQGQDWQLLQFNEGNTVWLDTITIMKHVRGNKLAAAEVFLNYFLGAEVQNRVVNKLSMVAVVDGVRNPMIETNPQFFEPARFWPPYKPLADNLMRNMSDAAMAASGKRP